MGKRYPLVNLYEGRTGVLLNSYKSCNRYVPGDIIYDVSTGGLLGCIDYNQPGCFIEANWAPVHAKSENSKSISTTVPGLVNLVEALRKQILAHESARREITYSTMGKLLTVVPDRYPDIDVVNILLKGPFKFNGKNVFGNGVADKYIIDMASKSDIHPSDLDYRYMSESQSSDVGNVYEQYRNEIQAMETLYNKVFELNNYISNN